MNIYFPIFYIPAGKVHSIQLGWDKNDRVRLYEKALGLKSGFDQHLLDPASVIQTVHVEEWYDYWSKLGIEPNILSYSKELQCFRYPEEAAAWIRAHPGKTWIIGNEPDGEYEMGGCQMSPEEYAEFYKVTSDLIRNEDPTAFLVMAGWAGGVGERIVGGNNEVSALGYYRRKYGEIDCQAFSFHAYQRSVYDNPYPLDKLNKFCEAVSAWKLSTDKVYLTEFGWHGLDQYNTPENCIRFMDWYIPHLRDHPQVLGWFWWEWNNGSLLMKDGVTTEVGKHYSSMREQ